MSNTWFARSAFCGAFMVAALFAWSACSANASKSSDSGGSSAQKTTTKKKKTTEPTTTEPTDTGTATQTDTTKDDITKFPTFESIELSQQFAEAGETDFVGFHCQPTSATTAAAASGAEVTYGCTPWSGPDKPFTGEWTIDEFQYRFAGSAIIYPVDFSVTASASPPVTFTLPSETALKVEKLFFDVTAAGTNHPSIWAVIKK